MNAASDALLVSTMTQSVESFRVTDDEPRTQSPRVSSGQKLSVAHVFNEFCIGPGMFRYQIVANPHIRSTVFCTRRVNSELYPHEPVYVAPLVDRLRRWHHLGRSTTSKLANLLHRVTWKQFLNRFQPDVLHVQFGDKAVRMLRLLRAANCPFIVTFHGSDINTATFSRRYCEQLRTLFAEANCCHFVSRDLLCQAVELGCPAEKGCVVRLGSHVPPNQALGSERLEDCVFACVASLLPCKGHETLLKAFADVRRHVPAATLHLFGDGPLRDRLEWLSRHLLLGECVLFHGSVPHNVLQRRLSDEIDVVVLASQRDDSGSREGLPISLNEAGALGLPCVATRCGGVGELVEDGATGFLADERDTGTLAERMTQLSADPELRRGFGSAARERVNQQFNLDKQHLAFEGLYRRMSGAGIAQL